MTTTDQTNRWRNLFPLFLGYLLAFPLAMAWVETRVLNGPTICMFRLLTHLDCPGCGLTRAFRAMGRLDVLSAFRYNPLGPAVFFAAVGLWVYMLAWMITRGRIRLPAWWTTRQNSIITWAFYLFLFVGLVRIIYELFFPPALPTAPEELYRLLSHWAALGNNCK